jgi:hypothetical protein
MKVCTRPETMSQNYASQLDWTQLELEVPKLKTTRNDVIKLNQIRRSIDCMEVDVGDEPTIVNPGLITVAKIEGD